MDGLLDNNESILKDAKGKLTLPPALTCALELEVASKSQARGMYGMRSVALVLVDVEVEGSAWGSCVERQSYGFLDLKALFFLFVRFISMMINVKEKDVSIT